MENEALRREVARELQAVIILGRGIAPLQPEKHVRQILTHGEVLVLQYLYLFESIELPVWHGRLASLIHIGRSKMGKLLNRLESEKYILLRYEGGKPPRTIVALTAQGKDTARQAIVLDVKKLATVPEFFKDETIKVFLETVLGDIYEGIIVSL